MTANTYSPSWGQMNAMGEAEATYLVREAVETENPCLIVARIRAMMGAASADGRDVGFMFYLAHAAMRGIRNG